MILNDSNTKTFVSYVSQNMRKASIDHQLLLLNSNRKLCFYTLFKTDTTKTDSLDAIENRLHGTAIDKFRLGNHQLHIETGRHTVPKTPEKLRICTLCPSNDVENESHVLFSCALSNNFRSNFFDEITGKYKFFKD